MNHSNSPAGDNAFPAVFIVVSTFLGAAVWLGVLLASMAQH